MTDRFFLLVIATCLLGVISGCRNVETITETVPIVTIQTTIPTSPTSTPTSTPISTPLSTPTSTHQDTQYTIQEQSVNRMSMIYIPGGRFQIGSTEDEIAEALALCHQYYQTCNRWYYEREAPQHSVTLDAYWIDKTEVSNSQYRLCVEAGVCEAPSTCKKGEPTFGDPDKVDHPVVCVDWEDAQTYCQWAGARLPTEAEWEYAFRGNAGSLYPWGDEFEGSRLNYCDVNCSQSYADDQVDDGYVLTAPAGSFPAGVSWAGVLNMGGNVSEWVADWFGDYGIESVSNPSGPEAGREKMVKGGSWFFHPAYCRGSTRPSVDPGTRFDYLGFRCSIPANQMGKEGTNMTSDSIIVPPGNPPTTDGTISPEEWADAAIDTFADGSQLFLMQDGEFLYVGIRAKESRTVASNVFVQWGDEITIMHSSAALGTAIYQKGDTGWLQVQDFTWRCRNTGYSESALAERAEFLQDEGWIAANALMGTPNELEYKIKIPDEDFKLAVVYIKATRPYEKVPWPAELDDDCIAPASGGLSKEMQFSPDKWMVLDFLISNGNE